MTNKCTLHNLTPHYNLNYLLKSYIPISITNALQPAVPTSSVAGGAG